MAIGVTFIIISILVIAIWVIIEVKRLKHKIFAIFLIGLIIFGYLSFTAVVAGKNIDLKTASGLTQASKLYMSWLGTAFGNVKIITGNAINMDWKTDKNSTENKK